MNLVMMKSPAFWSNGNLVNCFLETQGHLVTGLERGFIGDVFFPEVGHLHSFLTWLYNLSQVNLLDRIKNKKVIGDVVGHLNRKIRRYEQTNNIMDIFN